MEPGGYSILHGVQVMSRMENMFLHSTILFSKRSPRLSLLIICPLILFTSFSIIQYRTENLSKAHRKPIKVFSVIKTVCNNTSHSILFNKQMLNSEDWKPPALATIYC